MDYKELFDYDIIRKNELDNVSIEELCKQIIDLPERLIIYDFINSLIDEIEEKKKHY